MVWLVVPQQTSAKPEQVPGAEPTAHFARPATSDVLIARRARVDDVAALRLHREWRQQQRCDRSDRTAAAASTHGATEEPRRHPPWLAGQSARLTSRGARSCLLYTSDAADDLLCVDLGGRR